MARTEKGPSFQDVLKQVKQEPVRSLYFLYGEETFLADQVTDAIIQKVFQAPKDDFNLHIFYSKETDMTTVLNTAMSFPMMAERKVVILRDMHQLNKADRDALTAYCNNPLESTCLVAIAAEADFRQKLDKLLKERAVCLELKPLREYETPAWIESFARQHGKNIQSKAALLLASRVDVSLRELDSQVEKLATYVGTREEINDDDVENVIGVSRQYNIFELCHAVGHKDLAKALHVFDQMFRFGEEPVGMIIMLYRRFIILLGICDMRDRKCSVTEIEQYVTGTYRVSPYFFQNDYWPQAGHYTTAEIEKVFMCLTEADTELKSSVMDKPIIMQRLLYRIIRGQWL